MILRNGEFIIAMDYELTIVDKAERRLRRPTSAIIPSTTVPTPRPNNRR